MSRRKKSRAKTTYVTCRIIHPPKNPTKIFPNICMEYVQYRVNYIQTTDVSAKWYFCSAVYRQEVLVRLIKCDILLLLCFPAKLLALITLTRFNPQHFQTGCWNSWFRSANKLPSKASWWQQEMQHESQYLHNHLQNWHHKWRDTTNIGPTNTSVAVGLWSLQRLFI